MRKSEKFRLLLHPGVQLSFFPPSLPPLSSYRAHSLSFPSRGKRKGGKGKGESHSLSGPQGVRRTITISRWIWLFIGHEKGFFKGNNCWLVAWGVCDFSAKSVYLKKRKKYAVLFRDGGGLDKNATVFVGKTIFWNCGFAAKNAFFCWCLFALSMCTS